jgi:hypothetical protein
VVSVTQLSERITAHSSIQHSVQGDGTAGGGYILANTAVLNCKKAESSVGCALRHDAMSASGDSDAEGMEAEVSVNGVVVGVIPQKKAGRDSDDSEEKSEPHNDDSEVKQEKKPRRIGVAKRHRPAASLVQCHGIEGAMGKRKRHANAPTAQVPSLEENPGRKLVRWETNPPCPPPACPSQFVNGLTGVCTGFKPTNLQRGLSDFC